MVADCEIMQRMVEVPRGSPPDLSAAREYFADLVARFDSQVVCLRNELDNAQRHVNSQIRATSFTPQGRIWVYKFSIAFYIVSTILLNYLIYFFFRSFIINATII